jgi:excisionase family DNA binding protein
MEDRWLSVAEVAAYLGVNRDTLYKWIERKRMPAKKVGRLWKFKKAQIDEWVNAGKAGEREPKPVMTHR